MWIGQKIQLSLITYETVACILKTWTFATSCFFAYKTLQETYKYLINFPNRTGITSASNTNMLYLVLLGYLNQDLRCKNMLAHFSLFQSFLVFFPNFFLSSRVLSPLTNILFLEQGYSGLRSTGTQSPTCQVSFSHSGP